MTSQWFHYGMSMFDVTKIITSHNNITMLVYDLKILFMTLKLIVSMLSILKHNGGVQNPNWLLYWNASFRIHNYFYEISMFSLWHQDGLTLQ